MNINIPQSFQRFYSLANHLGAANILKKYLNLSADQVIPLSIAHGVDWDFNPSPEDIFSLEPIHWCCCHSLENTLQTPLKPIFFAPHPWLMNIQNNNFSLKKGLGTLLIGPPPSPANDLALFELVKDKVETGLSILIKPKAGYEASMKFWENRGVSVVTAGKPDSYFYSRLFAILNNVETVIGVNFSSALVFAASINKDIKILKNYSYQVIESDAYETKAEFNRPAGDKIIKIFMHSSQNKIQEQARHLLGNNLLHQERTLARELLGMIKSLKYPLFYDPKNPIPFFIRKFLLQCTKKNNLFLFTPKDYAKRIFNKHKSFLALEVNEFDIWENGRNASNYKIQKTLGFKNNIMLGDAPNPYDVD